MNHILYVFCFNVITKLFCHTLRFNFYLESSTWARHWFDIDKGFTFVHITCRPYIMSFIWLLLLINRTMYRLDHIIFVTFYFVTWSILSFYFNSCHTRVVAIYSKDCLPTKSAFDSVFQFNDWIQRNAIWHNQWR